DVGQGNGFSIEGWINPVSVPVGNLQSIVMSDGFENTSPSLEKPAGTIVSGWLVETGSVDVLSVVYGSIFAVPDTGKQCLDLNGAVPGAISRSFTTVVGQTYQLSLAYT